MNSETAPPFRVGEPGEVRFWESRETPLGYSAPAVFS
jgi:hypothetical protein